MKRTWIALLFLLLVPALVSAVEVEKSPNDDRQYQYLALPNGLKVLLVSDPETDKAAAALTVGVGSTSNPPGREGLAHFLEHMLFMGTKKYPDVDEYSDFIKRHGGSDNAFTGSNQTTYYFDIKPEALEPALDRFAQFFIAPLMDARYVEREKHAVHSEYQLKLKDDDRRIGAAQRQSYNPRSPYSRFSVGNLDTLADRPGHPVREDLLEFYRKHYSADIMGLVVIGKESLPVLRKWVEKKFTAVPRRGAKRYRPTPDEFIYLPQQLPVKVSVVPLKTLHRLELNFLMPAVKAHYREDPLYYISHFIGDEGPGSLHALLRKRGWITSLTSSDGALDDEQSYFTVEMELTEEGLKQVDGILEAFFAYAELLRSRGVEQWRFEELKRKKALDFRFKEKGSPSNYAVALSGKLLDYPPQDVLTAGNLLEHYDPKLIQRMLDRLRPRHLSLTLVHQGVETDRVEPLYQVAYSVGKPDALPDDRFGEQLLARLKLPEPNPFLPERVELKPIAQRAAAPRPLHREDGMSLWHQQDDEFGTPRGAFAASFEFPQAQDTPRHAVLLELLVDLVNDQLNEYSYPASVAGLSYSLSRSGKGLLLLVYGYDDKQTVLLSRVVEALAEPKFSRDRFLVYKKKLARELTNKAMDRPFRQVLDALHRAVVSPAWSPREQLAALEKVSLEDLQQYANRLFERSELRMLAYGNLTEQEARKMEGLLRTTLLGDTRLAPVPDPVVRRLEPGKPERVRYQVDHPDSVVAVYFQGEGRDAAEQARWQLLAQILQSPFYTELRTEQQLGYVVAAVPLEKERLPGLLFLVQSSAVSAREAEKRIQTFIDEIARLISTMDDEEFEAHKAGLVSKLLKQDKNTLERALRYMDNLEREEYQFDFRRKLAAEVEKLDRQELLAFHRQRLLQEPRKLVVYSPGTRFPEDSGSQAGG